MTSIVKYTFLITLIIFYFIDTIKSYKLINQSVIFSGSLKRFHLVMIWLFPFIWSFILKNLIKSSPGSHEVEKKIVEGPFFDAYKNSE